MNAKTGQVRGHIAGVKFASALALSGDNTTLYAVRNYSFEGNTSLFVYAVSAKTLQVVASSQLVAQPYGAAAIAVSPDKSRVYLSTFGGLLLLDGTTLQQDGVVALQGGGGFAYDPSRAILWVGSQSEAILAYGVNTATEQVATLVPSATQHYGNALALSAAGDTLYVATLEGLSVVSVLSASVREEIAAPGLKGPLAVSRDGVHVYEAGYLVPGVFEFDVNAQSVVTFSDKGQFVIGIQFFPGSKVLCVLETTGIVI